jgi:glycogen operon protein
MPTPSNPSLTDPIDVWPGRAYPLGATYDGAGTNFSLFSEAAERVALCLFADDGTEQQVELDEVRNNNRNGASADSQDRGSQGGE